MIAERPALREQRGQLFVRHFDGGHMFHASDGSGRALRDWVRGCYD